MVVLIFNHVYWFWQKNHSWQIGYHGNKETSIFEIEIENFAKPSYEKSPNLVAIDPKLKKLSTGKQNLRGKHISPVLIGLMRHLADR